MKLILIRHGAYDGQYEYLNARGILQMERIAEYVRTAFPFLCKTTIYTSHGPRAMESGQRIAEQLGIVEIVQGNFSIKTPKDFDAAVLCNFRSNCILVTNGKFVKAATTHLTQIFGCQDPLENVTSLEENLPHGTACVISCDFERREIQRKDF